MYRLSHSTGQEQLYTRARKKCNYNLYFQLQLQVFLNFEIQQKIHWDWPAVSEAIRGRPGYIIYYKLDKYKEIRRYISIYILYYGDLVCLAEKCGVAPILFHVYENSHVNNIFEARANSGDNKRRYKNTKIRDRIEE